MIKIRPFAMCVYRVSSQQLKHGQLCKRADKVAAINTLHANVSVVICFSTDYAVWIKQTSNHSTRPAPHCWRDKQHTATAVNKNVQVLTT
jgi:hypothetical protein